MNKCEWCQREAHHQLADGYFCNTDCAHDFSEAKFLLEAFKRAEVDDDDLAVAQGDRCLFSNMVTAMQEKYETQCEFCKRWLPHDETYKIQKRRKLISTCFTCGWGKGFMSQPTGNEKAQQLAETLARVNPRTYHTTGTKQERAVLLIRAYQDVDCLGEGLLAVYGAMTETAAYLEHAPCKVDTCVSVASDGDHDCDCGRGDAWEILDMMVPREKR